MTQTAVATVAAALAQVPTFDANAVLVGPSASPAVYLGVYAFNRLEAGATWDTDLWDSSTGTLSPEVDWYGAGTWESIGSRVRGLSWDRGCQSPLDRPRVGTAQLTLDNRDGALSAWTNTGAFKTQEGDPVTPGAHVDGLIWPRPGTLIRFGMFVGAGHTWTPLFTGRLAAQTEDTSELVDGWQTYDANELTADLGAFNGEQQPSQGGGETLSQRVARLLADALWDGSYTVQSDTIGNAGRFQATQLAQNRITELYVTGDSVGMRVLCGSDGQLRVTSPQPDPALTSNHTFSNFPGGGELPTAVTRPYASTDRIVNIAIAARVGSTEQQIRDNPSINRYGQLDPGGSRSDLIVTTDAMVRAMLRQMVALSKDDYIGIDAVDVDCDMDPVNMPAALAALASDGLETRNPFTVKWKHPSGNVFTQEVVLEGLSCSITPVEPGAPMKWTATLSCAKHVT